MKLCLRNIPDEILCIRVLRYLSIVDTVNLSCSFLPFSEHVFKDLTFPMSLPMYPRKHAAIMSRLYPKFVGSIQKNLISCGCFFLLGFLRLCNTLRTKCLLSGSFVLHSITDTPVSHPSDIDIYVLPDSVGLLLSVLHEHGYRNVLGDGESYPGKSGGIEWLRMRYYHEDKHYSGEAYVDIDVIVVVQGTEIPESLSMLDLKRSFDMSGCAASFDGNCVHVPYHIQTLSKTNIVSSTYFKAYHKVLESSLCGVIPDVNLCRSFGLLLNSGTVNHVASLRDAVKVVRFLQLTLYRMLKYQLRGFQIKVMLSSVGENMLVPFPMPFQVLRCRLEHISFLLSSYSQRVQSCSGFTTASARGHVSGDHSRWYQMTHPRALDIGSVPRDSALMFYTEALDSYHQLSCSESIEYKVLFSYYALRFCFLFANITAETQDLLNECWKIAYESLYDAGEMIVSQFINWQWIESGL